MEEEFSHKHPPNLVFSNLSRGPHPVINLNRMSSSSSKKYIDFELTSLQLQQAQAKLPSIYMLINPNNGDLDKMRENNKNKNSMGIHYEEARENPPLEKVLGGGEGIKSHSDRKKKKKEESEKSKEDEKEGKIKKNSFIKKKIIEKKCLTKNMNTDKKNELNLQEQLQPAETKERPKANESEILKRQEGEKEKELKKRKNFLKESPGFEENPEPMPPVMQDLMEFELKVPILPFQNKNNVENEELPISFAIPNLRTGLPRFIHRVEGEEQSDTLEINNLKFMFGLHYGLPFDVPVPRLNEKQKNFCNNVLQKLKSHKSSQSFRVPVDPIGQGVPDYHFSIYNPMDLQTISKKLVKDKYKSTCEFHADINTIFLNSYKYNLRGTFYFEAAIGFEDYYHSVLKDAEERTEEYSKEFMSKVSKVKKVEDFGELEFTEQTPFKKRRKGEGNKLMNIMRSQTLENISSKVENMKKLSSHNDQNIYHSNSFLNDFGSSLNSISVDDKANQNREKINEKKRKINSSLLYEHSGTELQAKGIIPEHSHNVLMNHSFQNEYPQPYFEKGFKSQNLFYKFSENGEQNKNEIEELGKERSEIKKFMYPYETQNLYGTLPIYQQEALFEHSNFSKEPEITKNIKFILSSENRVFENEKIFIEPPPFLYHNVYNPEHLDEYMGIEGEEMILREGDKELWGKSENRAEMTKRGYKMLTNDDYNDNDVEFEGELNEEEYGSNKMGYKEDEEGGQLEGNVFGVNYVESWNKNSEISKLNNKLIGGEQNQLPKTNQQHEPKTKPKRILNPNLVAKHLIKIEPSASTVNNKNKIGPKSLKNKRNYSDEEYRCSDDEDEFVGNFVPKKNRERSKRVSINTEINEEVYLPRKKEKQEKNRESEEDHYEEKSLGSKSGPSFEKPENVLPENFNNLGQAGVMKENSEIFMEKNESEEEENDGIDLEELM